MPLPPTAIRRAALAATLALALALGACGGGGEEGKVKDAVNGFYDALGDRDAGKVCSSLSDVQRKRIENGTGATGRSGAPQSCEKVIRVALAFVGTRVKQLKDVKVSNVSVHRDKATARVELKGKRNDLGLVKQGGDWKLSTFDIGR